MAGCMVRTVSFNIVRCIEGGMACRLWHLSMPCGMLFAARTVERRDIRSARIPVAVARGDPPPAKRDCATQCSTHHCRGSPGGQSPLDWPNDTDCAAQCDGAGAAQAVRPKGEAETEAETGKRKAYEPLCGGRISGAMLCRSAQRSQRSRARIRLGPPISTLPRAGGDSGAPAGSLSRSRCCAHSVWNALNHAYWRTSAVDGAAATCGRSC